MKTSSTSNILECISVTAREGNNQLVRSLRLVWLFLDEDGKEKHLMRALGGVLVVTVRVDCQTLCCWVRQDWNLELVLVMPQVR